MEIYELARWAALIEAVELISSKAEQRGIDLDSKQFSKLLDSGEILKYVDKRSDVLVDKLEKTKQVENNIIKVL